MKEARRITPVGLLEVTEEQRQAARESPEFQAFLDLLARLALDKFRRQRAHEMANQ